MRETVFGEANDRVIATWCASRMRSIGLLPPLSCSPLCRVSIQTKPTVSASPPVVVHDLKRLRVTPSEWDVLPDGRLVAIQKGAGEDDLTEVNLVLNWFEELKARVPTK